MKETKTFCLETNLKNTISNSIDDLLCDLDFIKSGKDKKYANVASLFDIEASSFYEGDEKRAIMYAWVFGINGRCMFGRTWEEFGNVIRKLVLHYDLSLEKRLIIYVHNLSYEFQFFKDYFSWDNVFSLDERKPIYAVANCGIEFRCSYILSNLSLAKVGENLTKYKVNKMVGDLNYDLVRHTETPLTEAEWGYIQNDGLVVMAYIQEEIERLGGINNIPLTSTGYVRDYCREACFKNRKEKFTYSKMMNTLVLNTEDYYQFKRAYTGGFTHSNANYVGDVLHNVSSYDFTSSYPAVMLSEKYPMSTPRNVILNSEKDFLIYLNNYCCIFEAKFKNIVSTARYENYISYSKCYEIEHYILNNGRVSEASTLSITLTELDFFVISDMYTWDSIEITNFKIMDKGYLPKPLIEVVLELYNNKTTLKGVAGKEAEYQASKAMVNSIYGMCVTDPCRDLITYTKDKGWGKEATKIEEALQEYNEKGNRFLYYAWGVWITAYARFNLFTGINEFKDDYIYSDTDSVKVLNAEKHSKYFEKYNAKVGKKVESCLKHYGLDKKLACPKTIKGVSKPIGVWDYEGTYTRFKTMGAKRYLYEEDNEIHITIAGVGKKLGAEYLKNVCKNNTEIFNKFDEGLYFPATYLHKGEVKLGAGKLCHTYIDMRYQGLIKDYQGNTCEYDEWSSVHLEATSYERSLASEFINYLLGVKED